MIGQTGGARATRAYSGDGQPYAALSLFDDRSSGGGCHVNSSAHYRSIVVFS